MTMTNSATQTQAGTPGTPTDPHNVAAAGEKEAAATASFYHSAWPPVDPTLWHSGPSSLGGPPLSSPAGRFHQVSNLFPIFLEIFSLIIIKFLLYSFEFFTYLLTYLTFLIY